MNLSLESREWVVGTFSSHCCSSILQAGGRSAGEIKQFPTYNSKILDSYFWYIPLGFPELSIWIFTMQSSDLETKLNPNENEDVPYLHHKMFWLSHQHQQHAALFLLNLLFLHISSQRAYVKHINLYHQDFFQNK